MVQLKELFWPIAITLMIVTETHFQICVKIKHYRNLKVFFWILNVESVGGREITQSIMSKLPGAKKLSNV